MPVNYLVGIQVQVACFQQVGWFQKVLSFIFNGLVGSFVNFLNFHFSEAWEIGGCVGNEFRSRREKYGRKALTDSELAKGSIIP